VAKPSLHRIIINTPQAKEISAGNYLFMQNKEKKWLTADHLTPTLSSRNLAEEPNHATVITMEGCEKNALMRGNPESNNAPPKGGFFLPADRSYLP